MDKYSKLNALTLKKDCIDDVKSLYHINKLEKIKQRVLDRYDKKYNKDEGDITGYDKAFEDGFFDEKQTEIIDNLYDKYFSKQEIQNIINRQGDENLEFLKKTIFKKTSYVTREEFYRLREEYSEKEKFLEEFSKHLNEIKNIPIKGKSEFTFYEVIEDENITHNDDGVIYTNSDYMYQFDDISDYGCVGTWSIIKEIIQCLHPYE